MSGAFAIEQELSKGKTTTVYRAYQTALSRSVLLKVLHPHLCRDVSLSERFRREALVCAKLRSPHIVQIYDLTDYEGSPALVMEYVEGRSLKEVVDGEGPLPEEQVKIVAEEVLRALVEAHANGIIHRDIKPANILMDRKGLIKVTDFGLAALAFAASDTSDGAVMGTPAYMSPEQIRGLDLDVRTDLFSLGVTLVELATGKQIFHGSTFAECFTKILQFKPETLELGQLSGPFQEFLRRLLAPGLQQRFPSAAEALDALTYKEEPQREGGSRKAAGYYMRLAAAGVIIIISFWLFLTKRPVPDDQAGPVQSVTIPAAADTQRSASGPPAAFQQAPEKRPTLEQGEQSDHGASNRTMSSVPDSGFLFLQCSPWGNVFVNDSFCGETPLKAELRVPAGTHAVRFENPLFAAIRKTVTVRKEEHAGIRGDFLAEAGYLRINVKPWAEIYVDGSYRETTPLAKPMVLSAGERSIRLHHPSYTDQTRTVHIVKGDTAVVDIDLRGGRQ